MPIYKGSEKIGQILTGSNELNKIYLGSNLVYQRLRTGNYIPIINNERTATAAGYTITSYTDWSNNISKYYPTAQNNGNWGWPTYAFNTNEWLKIELDKAIIVNQLQLSIKMHHATNDWIKLKIQVSSDGTNFTDLTAEAKYIATNGTIGDITQFTIDAPSNTLKGKYIRVVITDYPEGSNKTYEYRGNCPRIIVLQISQWKI